MAFAAEMLINTKTSITQVAEKIGFNDVNVLSQESLKKKQE
jgi:AraC-like DNA-binding protein